MKILIRSEMARSSLAVLLIQISFAGLSFLSTVVLAACLGKAGYGRYSFALAIVSLLAVPTSFGLPMLVVRETSNAVTEKAWGRLKGLWKWAGLFSWRIGIVVATTVVLLASLGLMPDQEVGNLVLIGCILVMLNPQLRIMGAAMQGLQFVVRGQLPDKVVQPALMLIVILIASSVWPTFLSPVTVMAIGVTSTLAALILSNAMLRSVIPSEICQAEPVVESKAWLSSVLPLAITSGMAVISRYADVVMLGFQKSEDAVAIYRVGAQVSSLIGFGLTGVNLAIAARVARLYQAGEREKLRRLVVNGSRGASMFAIPTTIGFVLFGRQFLVLFFKEPFAEAYLPTLILIGGQLFNALTGSVVYLLSMTGHEKDVSRGMLISAVANVILNALLIPFFDVIGAAIATSASLAICSFILWQKARKRLGIDCAVWSRRGASSADDRER